MNEGIINKWRIEKFFSTKGALSKLSLYRWEKTQMMYEAVCDWFAFRLQHPPPAFLLKTQRVASLPFLFWKKN